MSRKRNSKGCRLLRVALELQKFDDLASLGFRPDDFTGDAKVFYTWVLSHKNRYGVYPSPETVTEETGVLLPASCDFNLACDTYREFLTEQQITKRANEIVARMQAGDIAGAAALFAPLDIDRSPPDSFESGKFERYEEYEKRKIEGIQGVEIPWPSLADMFGKWENSTLNVLLAPSNTGKTWLACYIAAETMKAGHKVLLASMENTLASIGRRLDSLIYKVPFEDIRLAQADMRIEKRWRDKLPVQHTGDIVLVDQRDVKTPHDVAALVRSENPDLVIIDGAYMLRGEKGSRWESSANVIEDCQRLAQHGIPPWLCTSQLNPPTKKMASGYEMGYEARYAKEWMLVPSTSFLLLQSEDDRLFDRALIKVAKIREAGDVSDMAKEFYIHSNRTRMDFSEIPEDQSYDIEY